MMAFKYRSFTMDQDSDGWTVYRYGCRMARFFTWQSAKAYADNHRCATTQ